MFDLDKNGNVLVQEDKGGYYYTMSDGTKFYPGHLGYYTNCVGYAFAISQDGNPKELDKYDNSKPSFDPGQVEDIIKHDGFGKEFNDKNEAKAGDFVIYRNKKTGEIEHAAIVKEISDGKVIVQYTNNGLSTQQKTGTQELNDEYKSLNKSFVRRVVETKQTHKKSVEIK